MRLASRGLRDLDGRPERIGDSAELAVVRAQARRVFVQSVLATAVMMGVAWVAGS